MGFYYFSAIGTLVALASGVLLAGIFWLGWAFLARRKLTGRVVLVSMPVAMVLPWSEELWIAWHFGQACEKAGTFIYKTVEVDGFYDDTRTTHAGPRTAQAVEAYQKSGYRFFEMKGREKYVRIEQLDGEWKAAVLDRPTARYYFRSVNHEQVTYKIVRHESRVVDTNTNEMLGRELMYGRSAPWHYIGLDAPLRMCVGKRDVKGLLYENVLYPVAGRVK